MRDTSHELAVLASLLAVAQLVAIIGCGGKSVSEIAGSIRDAARQGADQVTKSVGEAAGQVQQEITQKAENVTDAAGGELGLAGKIELTVDAPLQTKACFARFIPSQVGRPSILQLQSYRDSQRESFPSVFARAQIPTGGLAELKGQTVAAQLFLQSESNGPTWYSKSAPVQLKITAIDSKLLTAEIAGGALYNTASGATQAVKGTFQGALP